MKNREGTCLKYYIVNQRQAAKNALSYSVGLYNILKDKNKKKKEADLDKIVHKPFQTDISDLKERLTKALILSGEDEDLETASLIEKISLTNLSSC